MTFWLTFILSDTVQYLYDEGITLELITNDAILDMVRKYPYLCLYYFSDHVITHEWFLNYTNNIYKVLGERYTPEFNVKTEFNEDLNLFVRNKSAAVYINAKKSGFMSEIQSIRLQEYKYHLYLDSIIQTVSKLSDVSVYNLENSISWKQCVISAVESHLIDLKEKIEKLKIQLSETEKQLENQETDSEKRKDLHNEYREMNQQMKTLSFLLYLPDRLEITDDERVLLAGKVFIIYGDAGTGKTQLLAHGIQQLCNDNRVGLLLASGVYLNDDSIQSQIMKNLQLDYSFEDLIDILETMGEEENCIIPIFIDALNETWNKKCWKNGLPAIIDKIMHCHKVKLVLTYRTGYEKSVLPDFILEDKEKGNIVFREHIGFQNNRFGAIKEFLNYYHIPFTPLEYFGYEMSNPLFLKLYCRTYRGTEISLPALYDELILQANQNMFANMGKMLLEKGYTEDQNILTPLITEITRTFIAAQRKYISIDDLSDLNYWNKYGLSPEMFISCLTRESILYNTVVDDEEEIYYFSYDRMNDYFCAKAVLKMNNSADKLRAYCAEHILHIEDGNIENYENIDLFVNLCALYAEKYGEECIGIIDGITNDYDRQNIILRYIESFQWRDSRYISKDQFTVLLNKYQCYASVFWDVLIGNSVKVSNPLNADYLHEFLMKQELNYRDYIWTLHINDFSSVESNRVVQLIQMYNNGEYLSITNTKQCELLLTLFGWLLTSSNRWLRDHTSKAMIEILKNNFDLCIVILQKFENVNDPYVIQRLYGVVFGACSKKQRDDFETYKILAEYVYKTIFDKEMVYPDILLRDYARLIIEMFLQEYPSYDGWMEPNKIFPPYNSEPIPSIEDQNYLPNKYEIGVSRIIHSMRFDGMGLYGDFGRYIFQSALHDFDVDDKTIYNYAIYFILNELGYAEKYFGKNDRYRYTDNRHDLVKIERIGKKYQWITMYNILARISDHCEMIDRYNSSPNDELKYEGPWQLDRRDFDPTFNKNFMRCEEAPYFSVLDEFVDSVTEENRCVDMNCEKQLEAWLETEGIFHRNLKDTLMLRDDAGTEWVALSIYVSTRKESESKKLETWSWLYTYFVSPEQLEAFERCHKKGISILTSGVASHNEANSLYNREYPWSSGCREINENSWIEVELKTGEKITKTVNGPKIYCSFDYEEEAKENELTDSSVMIEETENEAQELKITIEDFMDEVEVEEEENIGKILHATTTLMGGAEYDGTSDETSLWDAPCADFIKDFQLRQKEADGFYYDGDGQLAAFDVNVTQKYHCTVVRKDLLELFLDKHDLVLAWFVDCEKDIYSSTGMTSQWSTWEAVFHYQNNSIHGELRRCK